MIVAAEKDSKRRIPNEARWDEIVEAASGVFAEKGYRAATLQDIASRVGMLRGSLYYYIEGKEDLLFEIMHRGHLLAASIVKEDDQLATADPSARLAALIQRWMDGLQFMGVTMQLSEQDFQRYITDERRNEILSLRKQIAAVPVDIINAGIRDGSFSSQIGAEVVTSTLFRVLNTSLQWYRPDGRVTRQELTDWFTRLFLAGLVDGEQLPGAGPSLA